MVQLQLVDLWGVFLVFLKVTFLGYFAGCVDHNNMSVVSGDGKDDDLGWRALYRPGPEPVRARVLLVDYVNKVQGTEEVPPP